MWVLNSACSYGVALITGHVNLISWFIICSTHSSFIRWIFFIGFSPIVPSIFRSSIIDYNFLLRVLIYCILFAFDNLLYCVINLFLLDMILCFRIGVVHITSDFLKIVTKSLWIMILPDCCLIKLIPKINFVALSWLNDFNHVSRSV